MFWGLVLQPGKRYSSTVKESFHLSAAAVDTKSVGKNETGVFPVQVEVDGQELIIGNLSNQSLHMSVDLYFDKGTELTFMTTGKANIHLTGYTATEDSSDDESTNDEDSESSDVEDIKSTAAFKKDFKTFKKENAQKDAAGKRKSTADGVVPVKKSKLEAAKSSDEDESSGDELDNSDLGDFSFSEDNDEDDDEIDDDEQDDSNEDDSEIPEDSDSEGDAPSVKKKKKKEPQQPPHTPKPKKEQPVLSKKQEKTPGSNKKPEKLNKSNSQDLTNGALTKAEKKAQKKSLSKAEVKTPKGNESATSSPSPKKQSMEGGVVIEELKQGNGPVAKPGKMVAVYYTGRLKNNNRVFDQSNSGPGFKFRLGRGEVIKGWDVALNGMKVGSKRRITCPPPMAYGAKGSPPSIPPNSSLVFDVELRSVN